LSLRIRLLVAVGLIALIALIAADFATYSALRSFLYSRIDQTLETTTGPFGAAPGPGPNPGGEPPNPGGKLLPIFTERLTTAGVVEYTYGAYEPDGQKITPVIPAAALKASGTQLLTTSSTNDEGTQFRVLITTARDGDKLILGQPLTETAETLNRLLDIELAVTGGALVAAVLLGIWLVRVGLRPLQEIEDTAEAIANGELDRRVPGEEKRTEVGRLARVLNVMLARIQRAFGERDATEAALRLSEDRLRRFIADASHELRTPLAAVSAYAELYSRGASQHPDDLERVMRGIQGETARMKQLVDDLFLLARLDEGRPLEHAPVELLAVAADAIHAAVAVGPQWPITLVAPEPIEVFGDSSRLRQVLDNLLANVRSHTPPGTLTTVRLNREGRYARLAVSDNGPGLSAETAARVFERFYRADPSRSRTSGGSGLGLSIVWAIVNAHGGTVTVEPEPDGGVSFTVLLPTIELTDAEPDVEQLPAQDSAAAPSSP
jgi:two-component system OmpR family sensor kinase